MQDHGGPPTQSPWGPLHARQHDHDSEHPQTPRQVTTEEHARGALQQDEVLQTTSGYGLPPALTDLEDLQIISRLRLP